MRRVWVIGLESSGTQWVTGILTYHPEIEALHSSFPSDMGEARNYPSAPENLDAIVVVCRDRSCHRASVLSRGYETGTEDLFTDEESIEKIAALVRESLCEVLFVSYEGLLIHRENYLNWVWEKLGTVPVRIPVEYIDGNAKYLK